MPTLTQEQIVAALNEWMRRYTDEPERFANDMTTVKAFLVEEAAGETPSYGLDGAAYLVSIAQELGLIPASA